MARYDYVSTTPVDLLTELLVVWEEEGWLLDLRREDGWTVRDAEAYDALVDREVELFAACPLGVHGGLSRAVGRFSAPRIDTRSR